MLRRAAIRKYATSDTTSGERSSPDTGGRRRRIGARKGSVIVQAKRDTALVGCGLTNEKAILTNRTTMNAYRTTISREARALMFLESSGRTRPEQHLTQS